MVVNANENIGVFEIMDTKEGCFIVLCLLHLAEELVHSILEDANFALKRHLGDIGEYHNDEPKSHTSSVNGRLGLMSKGG